MKNLIAGTLASIFMPLSSHAGFTDFEQLVPGTIYSVNDSFTSDGLGFNVVSFTQRPNPSLGVGDLFNGTEGDTEIVLGTGGAGLDFQLPLGTRYVSVEYAADDPASIVVNGIASLVTQLPALDGTSIDGVQIEVKPRDPVYYWDIPEFIGTVILRGDIRSFTIGGNEIQLDNVTILVPEPGSVSLLLGCIASLAVGDMRHRVRRDEPHNELGI